MSTKVAAIKKGGSFLVEDVEPAEVFTPEDFNDEQRMFVKTAEDFIQNEVLANIERTEHKEEGVMLGLLKKAGELGLLMIDVPEAYGGLDLDKASSLAVIERIGPSASFATTFGGQANLTILPLVLFGTPAQKEKYLPRLVSGEIVGAYALSESGSGSDALAAKTRAALERLEAEAPSLGDEPFGIGQIAIGCALSYLDFRFAALEWRAGRPALTAWHDGFSGRPSATATAFQDVT